MVFKRLRAGKTIETEKAAALSSAAKAKIEAAVQNQNLNLINIPDSEAGIADEIRTSGYYILKTCHDMDEYFSAVSGKYKISPTKIELCGFIKEFCKGVEPFALKKGFGLMCILPKEAVYINADAEKLCYILASLVLNSMENSPVGTRVKISLSATSKFAKITVTDKGFGMDEETAAHCCEPFFSKNGDAKSRMGLGLTLAQHFAKESGGRMHISTKAAKGTSVSFLLLLAQKECDLTVESHKADIYGEKSFIFKMVFADLPDNK